MGPSEHIGTQTRVDRNAITGTTHENFHLPHELETSTAEELAKLDEKGAFSYSPVAQPYSTHSFVSRMFLVTKKNGSHKTIIDLRELNRSI